jgi:hypothetical protein
MPVEKVTTVCVIKSGSYCFQWFFSSKDHFEASPCGKDLEPRCIQSPVAACFRCDKPFGSFCLQVTLCPCVP